MVSFVVKRYAVRKAKKWRYAVCKMAVRRVQGQNRAVRSMQGVGGVTLYYTDSTLILHLMCMHFNLCFFTLYFSLRIHLLGRKTQQVT